MSKKRVPRGTQTQAAPVIEVPPSRNAISDREPRKFDSPLDLGIAAYVNTLMDGGVETFESCQGGDGHAYAEPTVRFHGNNGEGFRALAVAMTAQLPVASLSRIYPIIDGTPTGPYWQMVFYRPCASNAIEEILGHLSPEARKQWIDKFNNLTPEQIREARTKAGTR